ncbi:uncharacterized protein LOC117317972 [Pecten maximus]|uniref:uncharacterized protein LOC117317972 n=1 Tax=Pecten maximus TaxID=6579 RepID=UPI0014580B21|nr:uncharacterized protein LOC117317972 [Pecten maximus]
MMFRALLLTFGAGLLPVLATKDVCLCTNTDVILRQTPNPTAPIAGRLASGLCLNASQYERKGQWLEIGGKGLQSGYLFESDDVRQRSCPDHISSRSTHDELYCQHECRYAECCTADVAAEHHHGVHCGHSCDHHHCCNNPIWSHWDSCSVTCGIGTKHRHCLQHCSSQNPTQTQLCHKSACPDVTPTADHVCDKESVVQAVAFQISANCTVREYASYTPFLVQHCGAPESVGDWVNGTMIYTGCNTVPMYAPVATFHLSSHAVSIAGIFVGCEANGEFKVVTSPCGQEPQIVHISSTNSLFKHFYQIKW